MSFKIIIIIKYNNINVKVHEEINSSSLINKKMNSLAAHPVYKTRLYFFLSVFSVFIIKTRDRFK